MRVVFSAANGEIIYFCPFVLRYRCTEAAALAAGGAGHGGEAGGGVEAGRLPAPPLAGLLDDVDGVRLEGQTDVDLDDAPGAADGGGGSRGRGVAPESQIYSSSSLLHIQEISQGHCPLCMCADHDTILAPVVGGY